MRNIDDIQESIINALEAEEVLDRLGISVSDLVYTHLEEIILESLDKFDDVISDLEEEENEDE